jgi:hypothetical protein
LRKSSSGEPAVADAIAMARYATVTATQRARAFTGLFLAIRQP